MKRKILYGVGLLVALLIGAGIGATGAEEPAASAAAAKTVTVEEQADAAETVTETVTETVEQEAAAEPEAPAGSFGAGTYLVGEDIKAGTYKARGGGGCYWARLKNLSGEVGSIIANGGFEKNVIVQIQSSDKAFESSDCGDWEKV